MNCLSSGVETSLEVHFFSFIALAPFVERKSYFSFIELLNQKSFGRICVGLFMCYLFCSTELYVCLSASATQPWLGSLCVVVQ